MNLLIKNGRVIDPSQNIDDTLDVLVENGLVKKIGAGLSAPAGTETITSGFQIFHLPRALLIKYRSMASVTR